MVWKHVFFIAIFIRKFTFFIKPKLNENRALEDKKGPYKEPGPQIGVLFNTVVQQLKEQPCPIFPIHQYWISLKGLFINDVIYAPYIFGIVALLTIFFWPDQTFRTELVVFSPARGRRRGERVGARIGGEGEWDGAGGGRGEEQDI